VDDVADFQCHGILFDSSIKRWLRRAGFAEFSLKLIRYLKRKAAGYKREIYALRIAYRDPRTPWYAKLFVVLVIAYALSPVDLIPDFIPVFGYLDDIIILPLGVFLAIKLIPAAVLDESRIIASQQVVPGSQLSRLGTCIIVSVWAAALVAATLLVVRYYRS
jgi:uncharacterized membrane protein YkvA (DUF1232 family)